LGLLDFPSFALNNFITWVRDHSVGPGDPGRQALAASSAINVTYLMATGIALSGEGASDIIGRAQRKALRLASPPAPKPVGFDPAEVRDALLDLGALQDCDFAQLTDRHYALSGEGASDIIADLASWPAGSWSTSPAGSSLLDCDGISLRFFDTKQSRIKAVDVQAGLWSSCPVFIPRLSASRLEALGWDAERATLVSARCCVVRTLAEYMRRAAVVFDRLTPVVIGGRACLAPQTLLCVQAIGSSSAPRFLGAERINKRLGRFHDASISSPRCGSIHSAVDGGLFFPKHWRHVSASCIAITSSPSVAQLHLHHASAGTFRQHYEIAIPPGFAARWAALPASKLALSAVERLLV